MDFELNTPTSPLLAAALGYAAQGWQIIPLHSWVDGCCTCERPDCGSAAKHPITARGVHDATTDQETVRRWWAETQGIANVGIATGAASGLVVVDIDAKSGGLETLARLEQDHGKLPTTPTASTGGGGRHYFYRYPVGHIIGNRAGLLPGIDIRGEGGYVVAPPSSHASGNTYTWAVPPSEPVADAPPWLLDLMTGKPRSSPSTDVQQPPPVKANTLVVQAATDDLASHPGAAEGQRNDTLCRLVGAHAARDEDAEDILALALAWAKRCSPPLPAAEVARTVQGLAEKQQRKTALLVRTQGDGDNFQDLPLPPPPLWPTLDPAACHGLAGEVVQLFAPQTEADPVAILMSLLVVVGSIVGRRPFFPVEGDKHHANLFAVLVGDSSRGRKGTSLGRTVSLAEAVDPAWTKDCMTSGLTSGEGLIYAVRDPVETMEVVKEKGLVIGYESVIRDHGVGDKRLLVIESEFAQALRVLRREGNNLSPIIRSAWENGNLKTLAKNSPTKATDAHISVLGHITKQELAKYLSDVELFNGFANRFLWPAVRRSKRLPHGGQPLDLKPLQERLAKACAAASKIECMARSVAASAFWTELYPHLTAEDRAGLYAAATGRAEAQALRLSMLYALLDGSPIIDTPHLQAAVALWDYCDASAKIIFGHSETANPLETLLLDTIRKMPGTNRKALYKATGGHIPADAMVEALAALRDRALVRCETAATGGRPAERWHPCDQTTKGCGEASAADGGLSSFGRSATAANESSDAQPGVPQPTMPDDGNSQPKAEQEPDKPVSPANFVGTADVPPDAAAITKSLSLADLFNALNQVGGRLVRQGDAVAVDVGGKPLPPEVEAALATHQAALAMLVPIMPPAAVANPEPPVVAEAGSKPWTTDHEFFSLLKSPEGRARLAEWHAERSADRKHPDAADQAEPSR